ncbi:hypothetical protein Shyhy01_06610 [Streptomyces hygroscopicus subsp. hygroscopicus]|nr:hypothetical protein Shyhy01_06610 [Streptomyces hygroscopicus subsp. hygroscopicus]
MTSAACPDDGAVPRRFTRDGEDVSPPLVPSGVPAGTDSLAVADAPDRPVGERGARGVRTEGHNGFGR